jgi:predicted ester cyclase
MSEQENIKAAQGFFDTFNRRDFDTPVLYQSDDFISEGPIRPGPMTAAQSWAATRAMLTPFPDLKYEVLLTVAQGDYVVTHFKSTGTHTGPLMTASGKSIPATGRKVSLVGSMTARVKNGKVVHHWFFYDVASFLGQLGLLPPM